MQVADVMNAPSSNAQHAKSLLNAEVQFRPTAIKLATYPTLSPHRYRQNPADPGHVLAALGLPVIERRLNLL